MQKGRSNRGWPEALGALLKLPRSPCQTYILHQTLVAVHVCAGCGLQTKCIMLRQMCRRQPTEACAPCTYGVTCACMSCQVQGGISEYVIPHRHIMHKTSGLHTKNMQKPSTEQNARNQKERLLWWDRQIMAPCVVSLTSSGYQMQQFISCCCVVCIQFS